MLIINNWIFPLTALSCPYGQKLKLHIGKWSDAHPLFYQFCVVYLEIHLLTFMDSWSQNFQHRDAKIVA